MPLFRRRESEGNEPQIRAESGCGHSHMDIQDTESKTFILTMGISTWYHLAAFFRISGQDELPTEARSKTKKYNF